MKGKKEFTNEKSFEDIDNDLIANGKFTSHDNLDEDILNSHGLLCIKLKKNSRLSERYQIRLDEREHRFIYIGEAKTLKERISQQLGKGSAGTFFRNIGCALGYAKEGCLKKTSDKKKFVFADEYKESIKEWLHKNTEWSIVEYNGDRNIIKKELIKKYCPILNKNDNPKKLKELTDDTKKCYEIARS